MLRRIIPTAERTVTRGSDKKALTKERRLENAPFGKAFLSECVIGCFHMSGLFVRHRFLPLALIEIRR
jgi:hypothetical protein